jgi:hypothetical protein
MSPGEHRWLGRDGFQAPSGERGGIAGVEPAEQQRADLVRRHGRTEQEPLHLATPPFLQQAVLANGLDTFCDTVEAEVTCQAENRPGHRGRACDVRDIAYEGTVDLDLVEWKFP